MPTLKPYLLLACTLASLPSYAETIVNLNTKPFTANQLATQILQRNPSIDALTEAANVAIQRIEVVGALADPRVSYAAAPNTLSDKRGLNQKIEISQALPWSGKRNTYRLIAESKATAAQESIQAMRLVLTEKAKSAYAEWYFIHQAMSIHQATYSRVGELRTVAEAQYSAGKTLQQDVLQAELEQLNLDRQFLSLKRTQTLVRATINTLLNRDTRAPLFAPTSLPVINTIPPLDNLQQQAMTRHPELKRLDASKKAREAQVTLAKKAFYPDFTVSAGYNSLWDDPDKRVTVGISINVPLDSNKRRAGLQGARADVLRVEAQRQDYSLALIEEVARAHAQLQESIDASNLYQRSILPLANEYVETALSDYQSGAGSFLSVVAAEQKKLAIEKDYARNRADVFRYQAELERWSAVQHASVTGTPQ